jgi:peptide-methionine (R)-S-oxide reductase
MRNRVVYSILCLGMVPALVMAFVPAGWTAAAEDPVRPGPGMTGTSGTLMSPSLVPPNPSMLPSGELPVPTAGKLIKSEKEWLKQLTRAQFLVTRMKATEPAFSGKYVNNHAIGTYACVCCGAPLFNSRQKFESGTGWPSFWAPYAPERIQTAPDYHGAEPRVEVMCARCDAHLGHVFSDGPPPTGLRFCINSTSLKFLAEARAKTTKAKAKTTTKPGTPVPADTAAASEPAGSEPVPNTTDPATATPSTKAAEPAESANPAAEPSSGSTPPAPPAPSNPAP